jgi:hypothetical protein
MRHPSFGPASRGFVENLDGGGALRVSRVSGSGRDGKLVSFIVEGLVVSLSLMGLWFCLVTSWVEMAAWESVQDNGNSQKPWLLEHGISVYFILIQTPYRYKSVSPSAIPRAINA